MGSGGRKMDCKNARLVLTVAHPLTTELDAARSRAAGEPSRRLPRLRHLGRKRTPHRRAHRPCHAGRRGAAHAVAAFDAPTWRRARCLVSRLDGACRRYCGGIAGGGLARLGTVVEPSARSRSGWNCSGWLTFLLSSPEQVEDWFDYRLGVSMTAPPQFNYALLFDEGRAEFQASWCRICFSTTRRSPKRSPRCMCCQLGNSILKKPGNKRCLKAAAAMLPCCFIRPTLVSFTWEFAPRGYPWTRFSLRNSKSGTLRCRETLNGTQECA